jgi:hypothetical protein
VELTFGGSDGLYQNNILLQEKKKLRGFDKVASKANVFLTYIEVGIAGQHNPCRD